MTKGLFDRIEEALEIGMDFDDDNHPQNKALTELREFRKSIPKGLGLDLEHRKDHYTPRHKAAKLTHEANSNEWLL